MLDILGVVVARGGSKGIPRKNIALLNGKPLLAYTAEAALSAKRLKRVILSTDDREIAEVGRSCGLDVPFLRPEDLARDDTPAAPVLRHAVAALAEKGQTYDGVCLLQPTAPLRTGQMIDAACERFVQTRADTLLSVLEIPHHHHPHWALLADERGLLHWAMGANHDPPRRQDLPRAYYRDGSIYIVRTSVLMEQGTLYGKRIVPFPLRPEDVLNIDNPEDLAAAARRIAERQAGP